jgi:hypothetical protein
MDHPANEPGQLGRDRGFRAVMIGSSALGSGCLIASLTIMRSGPAGLDIAWSNWAIPAFIVGALIARLQAEPFPNFAMIAYESDIRVLRRDKF